MSKLTKKQKELLYTKDGKVRCIVKRVQDVYDGNGIFRPVETGHRGGRGWVKDISYDITSLINALGYKYKVGNDAPKGGKYGNFIKVSKIAADKIKSLK